MGNTASIPKDEKSKYKSFPGSAILEKTFCGSIDTTDPSEYDDINFANRLLKKADIMCVSSPDHHSTVDYNDRTFFPEYSSNNNNNDDSNNNINSSSALFARALVNEVTNNPNTMTPAEMAQRELRLIKAQKAANAILLQKHQVGSPRPVGTPGGVGPANVLHSLAYAVTGDEAPHNLCQNTTVDIKSTFINGQYQAGSLDDDVISIDENNGPFSIAIGLLFSRQGKHGHPDTVTRQTAFDFDQLQDRSYKYVSSTDGWRAAGGEKGGPVTITDSNSFEGPLSTLHNNNNNNNINNFPLPDKEPCVDTSHLPIIHIDCQNQLQVDHVIHALASGEIFIPHMSVLPDSLATNSTADLKVRFNCNRNEKDTPDHWHNWCLEFMHNQLYEYFYTMGARWNKRPFSMTLAKQVKFKTTKHMNRYYAYTDSVLAEWKARGPQCLTPQDASREEQKSPHGIYLLRNGVPTNYFAPNFEPPYTTKMTRSLLENVLNKSWNKKRGEWTSEPIPKLLSPSMLLAAACGCADPNAGGFLATEATNVAFGPTLSMPYQQWQQQMAPVEFDTGKELSSQRDELNETFSDEEDDIGSYHEEDEEDYNDRQSGVEEEKKADDTVSNLKIHTNMNEGVPSAEPTSTTSSSSSGASKARHDSAPSEFGQAPSEFGQSIAASGTTVMHHNLTARQKQQLFSDEDWPETKNPSVMARIALDAEKRRQTELLAQVGSNDDSPRNNNNNNKDKSSTSKYTMHPQSRKKSVDSNDLQDFSMSYSADGSSLFNQEASLLGQHFVNHQASTSPMSNHNHNNNNSHNMKDDDQSALSIQDSTSSGYSIVPTDEELYAVGWAKAMDENSGNYYYFTLDRKQIVWDNPLLAGGGDSTN